MNEGTDARRTFHGLARGLRERGVVESCRRSACGQATSRPVPPHPINLIGDRRLVRGIRASATGSVAGSMSVTPGSGADLRGRGGSAPGVGEHS